MDNGNIPREFDDESKPGIDLIVSVCCGLVTINQDIAEEESQVVRLVHYTTQEYLSQIRDKWFPEAEERIADVCAIYLSFDVHESGAFVCLDWFPIGKPYGQRVMLEEILQSNPFYAYASMNWEHHARESNTSSQIIQDFLADGNKFLTWAHVKVSLEVFQIGRVLLPEKEYTTDFLDEKITRLMDTCNLDTALGCAVQTPLTIREAMDGDTVLSQTFLLCSADPNVVDGHSTSLVIHPTMDVNTYVWIPYGADPNEEDKPSGS